MIVNRKYVIAHTNNIALKKPCHKDSQDRGALSQEFQNLIADGEPANPRIPPNQNRLNNNP